MAEKHSLHQTQWAAQFGVASELCKRDYQVAFTMGNHPQVDLMVISPSGVSFVVDVKGLYKKNFWVVKPKPARSDLHYVLAFVPKEMPSRYFILTQEEVNLEISAHQARLIEARTKKGRSIEKVGLFPGLLWSFVENFEDEWGKLPS